MNKQKTGEMIRQARMQRGYTQNELGNLLGVSNKAISRWENGDSFPDVGVLEQLSNTLELNIQDLVTGEVSGNCTEAVTEIARVARIQEKEKRKKIVVSGIVTGIYAVASVLITMALVNHGITPFHMDVNSVGPFVNWQLVLVFIINSICLASECVRVVVAEQGVHIGIYMIVFNIFLTMIYSNLLHRLVSLQEFNRAFILDTAAIAVEAIILFGLMLLFKRVLKKKV